MRTGIAALAAGAFMLAAQVPALAAPADPSGENLDDYPLADRDYTVPGAGYGWVFFTTSDGLSCGIAANGGPVGCDAVPADAPPGTNQTVATSWGPAEYRSSDTATFTRDAPVLPNGQRVQTLGAACAVDAGGAVHCQTQGNHGFILSADNAVLW